MPGQLSTGGKPSVAPDLAGRVNHRAARVIEDDELDPWAGAPDGGPNGAAARKANGCGGGAGAVTAAEEEALFGASPQLAHIARVALSRDMRPMAALVAVLARLAAETDPEVVLPPVISGTAGLSMLAALVGQSGAGKTSTWGLAEDMLRRWPLHARAVHPASGEGLVQALGEIRKPTDAEDAVALRLGVPAEALDTTARFRRRTANLHGWVDEVGQLTAVSGRAASTLMPTLRSMISGAALGSDLADVTRSRSVLPGTYRIGLGIGVTPRSGTVLYGPEAQDGTVQRLVTVRCGLWPGTWDADPPSGAVGPEDVPLPAPPGDWARRYLGGLTVEQMEDHQWRPGDWLSLPSEVAAYVREEHRRRMREADALDADADDGHAVLTRLRVAALLDLLHGRDPMTLEAWQLSDVVMRSSRADMAWQRQISQVAAQDDHREVGALGAHRKQGEADETSRLYREAWELITTTINTHAAAGGVHTGGTPEGPGCTRTCFTRAAPKRLRNYVGRLTQEAVGEPGEGKPLIAVDPVRGPSGGRPAPRFTLSPAADEWDVADLVDVTVALA